MAGFAHRQLPVKTALDEIIATDAGDVPADSPNGGYRSPFPAPEGGSSRLSTVYVNFIYNIINLAKKPTTPF